jgi:hypothetical protein
VRPAAVIVVVVVVVVVVAFVLRVTTSPSSTSSLRIDVSIFCVPTGSDRQSDISINTPPIGQRNAPLSSMEKGT